MRCFRRFDILLLWEFSKELSNGNLVQLNSNLIPKMYFLEFLFLAVFFMILQFTKRCFKNLKMINHIDVRSLHGMQY